MKKTVIFLLIFCALFSFSSVTGVRKKRKRTSSNYHTLILQNPVKFRSFIAEFLFEQTALKFNPDDLGNK